MAMTDRIFKGSILLVLIFINISLGWFFNTIYPEIKKVISIVDLPNINSNIFYLMSIIIFTLMIINWSIRNSLWKGIKFSLVHYFIIKNLRKQLSSASIQEVNINKRYITIPKIKIKFNDSNQTHGKIMIKNSIQFDKKLEELRIDSAIKHYVCERQYMSADRNWYIYEFYSIKSQKQIEFNNKSDYLKWCEKTCDDYEIRLDDRTTIPLHHAAFAGITGAGKTFFLQMLIDQLDNKNVKHELYVTDPKKADIYFKMKKDFAKHHISDKGEAISLIKKFYDRMLERQNELQSFFENNHNKTYKDAHLPALILLIDEFGGLKGSWNTLPKKDRDEIENQIAEIAFMGRQLGCFLWITTQQMNAQTVPTAVREQLVLKTVLGDSDEQTYKTLFSSSVTIPPIQYNQGCGLYAYPQLASVDKPRLLVLPYCSYLN